MRMRLCCTSSDMSIPQHHRSHCFIDESHGCRTVLDTQRQQCGGLPVRHSESEAANPLPGAFSCQRAGEVRRMVRIVAMGASEGGVEAVRTLTSRLPTDFPAAVLIVVHVGAGPKRCMS